jgi:hypothetical protein
MKKATRLTLMTIFVVLASLHLMKAQSWQPLTLHEKFNYSINGANLVTHSIWVDSCKVINGDSVFYLNRIVTACDTCSDPYYKLCNQATYLNKEMVKKPGGAFWFRYPGSYVIQSLAAVGQTWLYDTLNNIQAQVSQKTFEPVFGINDSVKRIHLTNGTNLYLSKSFGLIRFPYNNLEYNLEGIEGRNLGQKVPDFSDIYNFNVGDVFQYHSKNMSYAMGGGYESLYKRIVTSKDSATGVYWYEETHISCGWYVSLIGLHGDSSHYYDTYTLNLIDSANHVTNLHPDQIFENPIDPNIVGPVTSYLHVLVDDEQLYTKYIGSSQPYVGVYVHGTAQTPPLPYELLIPGPVDQYMETYKPGLGRVFFYLWIFEGTELDELIGYVKNGDTVGIIYPDETLLMGMKNRTGGNHLTIYPNPASGFITVKEIHPSKDLEFEISDLTGQIIKKDVYTGGINVSQLANGLYILKISDRKEPKSWYGRFTKN